MKNFFLHPGFHHSDSINSTLSSNSLIEDYTLSLAVKVIDLSDIRNQKPQQERAKIIKSIIREVQAVHSIDHKNIIKYYGLDFESLEKIYVVMELCEHGTLHHQISQFKAQQIDKLGLKNKLENFKEKQKTLPFQVFRFSPPIYKIVAGLPSSRVKNYITQLVDGVSALHRYNIIHRDLKPENIFISDSTLKIGDFGSATRSNLQLDDSSDDSTGSDKGLTVHYSPPEQWNSDLKHNLTDAQRFKYDIWSLGCVLFEMIIGARIIHTNIHEQVIIIRFLTRYKLRRNFYLTANKKSDYETWNR